MKKTLESTGDVCVKFTEEELLKLNIKEGDKFSITEMDGGFLLKKYENVEIDLSELSREALEMLVTDSCNRDISVNEVISEVIKKFIEKEKFCT